MLQRLIGHYPGPDAEQGSQRPGQPQGEIGGEPNVTAANVGMGQGRFARQALQSARQGVAKVAQQKVGRIRPAGRMSMDLPLEDEDFAAWQKLAQMIVGAPVAQAELEHRARQICNLRNRDLEAGTLRLEPPDKAVEPAHHASLCKTHEHCHNRSKGQHRIDKPS
jgi:hypothetical protein